MHHTSPTTNGARHGPGVFRQLLRRIGLARCVLVLLSVAGAVTLALPALVLLPVSETAGPGFAIPGQQPKEELAKAAASNASANPAPTASRAPSLRGPAGTTFKGAAPSLPPQVRLLAKSGAQVPPLTVPGNATPIRLLISAFQDGDRCANTLLRALVQARHPERVSFNVLQAVGPTDVRCLDEFRDHRLHEFCGNGTGPGCAGEVIKRVRFWTITLEEGKGPVHQRGLLSEVADLSGEGAMCLSTDSHMDFTQGWDSDLLQDWASAQNEFAVTSAYPMATPENGAPVDITTAWVMLCGYFLTEQDVPRGATGWPMEAAENETGTPQLTMNWAAGQSFSRCHAERNVPPDKNLLWTFNGEEVNRAVRLWTHGYDLYNPRVNVVLHNYTHPSQKYWSFASLASMKEIRQSEVRLKALLQGTLPQAAAGKYGLGNQRTIAQYVTHFRTNLGGRWTAYLRERGIHPNFEGVISRGGAMQPGSVGFCGGLKRFPVRDAGELVASTV